MKTLKRSLEGINVEAGTGVDVTNAASGQTVTVEVESAVLTDISDAAAAAAAAGASAGAASAAAADAQFDADAAQADATQALSDIATLDANSVKTAGDQSVDGVKTFDEPPRTATNAVNANDLVRYAQMQAEIQAAKDSLITDAPALLDTLGEIAAELENQDDVITAILSGLDGKLAKASNLSDLLDVVQARINLGLGNAATKNVGTGASDVAAGDAPAAAQAAAIAASQPLDSDLTAIAALSTTAYGRAFLALADAAAGRSALGLGTAATSNTGDFQPTDADLTAIAALSTTAFGRSLLTLADAAALAANHTHAGGGLDFGTAQQISMIGL